MSESEQPFVSIVIAVKNEEPHIKECVEAFLNQDYPREKYEILVVDGRSKDRTREIVEELMKSNEDILKLIDNPEELASPGRNKGILAAKGDYVGVFGGHTIAKPDWISVLIKILIESEEKVAAVGSTTLTGSPTLITEAQEVAFNSIFGGFRTAEAKQIHDDKAPEIFESESMCFSLYKKKALIEVGLNDVKLFSGDDAELHIRIRKAGYKLLGTTKSKVKFYRRKTLKKFYKRMYEFGQGRALIMKRHRDSFQFFFLIPVLFTLFCFVFGAFNLITFILNVFFNYYLFGTLQILSIRFDTLLQLFYLSVIILYFLLAIVFMLISSKKFTKKKASLLLLILYPSMHIGFGLGIIRGLFPYRKITPQR